MATSQPISPETLTKIDAIFKPIIFQAGYDHDSNPLLVLCASKFPSPKDLPIGIDFTMLMNRALSLYSTITNQSHYSLIIFSSPSEFSPNIKQIISSYLNLNSFTRKNLKKLWIVHPSFWSKMTLQIFLNGIVSWKFHSKVKWIHNLSQLAVEVPIQQICIPPEVYKVDLEIEPSITMPPNWKRKPVLGTFLEELMGNRGENGIPQLVQDSVNCIRSTGLNAEGLFRRPPSLITLRVISEAYDRGHPVQIDDYPDGPYLAASLLKQFLRQLPIPIFTSTLYPIITNCPLLTNDLCNHSSNTSIISEFNPEAVTYIREKILVSLSTPALKLLDYVLEFAHELALHAAENKMGPHNLATCLAPTLLRSDDLTKDAAMCKLPTTGRSSPPSSTFFTISGTSFGSVLKFMITNYEEIFDDLNLLSPNLKENNKFVSAPTSPSSYLSSSITSTSTKSSYQDLTSDHDHDHRHLPKISNHHLLVDHHYPHNTISVPGLLPKFHNLLGSYRSNLSLNSSSIIPTTKINDTNVTGRVSVKNLFNDVD
ncbi:hypothetical protein CROQUDRAFT_131407 [Cronartium quercuum f. sp. fusiforme G11]|uniref:Rho-GAP domain-containing protein n=1 Tax=Cronartium quercuum f. sp. fusiforme G11 TaxID=708437 RepID=A0A9P6NNR5_9BASI|nr:hypothetical protein CROQUDRAFT_131407 [Cronartium quercuum f. sp. fusiforme G11]